MDIRQLIGEIAKTPDCVVHEPRGLPLVHHGHILPEDLRIFYELCGGISLFEQAESPVTIVGPHDLTLANPVIIHSRRTMDDISWSWYIMAIEQLPQYMVIDLDPRRLGRCYDGFWDIYAIVGSCPIIATSFTDLLTRLFENRGHRLYFLTDDFTPLGDAYDQASN